MPGLPKFKDFETPLNAANMNALRNAIISNILNISSLRSSLSALNSAVGGCLPLDGSKSMAGDLDMGGYAITNASFISSTSANIPNITTLAGSTSVGLASYLDNLSSRLYNEEVKTRSLSFYVRAPLYASGDCILGGGASGSHYQFDEDVHLKNIKVTLVVRSDVTQGVLAFSLIDSSGTFFSYSDTYAAGSAHFINEDLSDRLITTSNGISIKLDDIRGIKHATFVLNYY